LAFITFAHHALIKGNRKYTILGCAITILLASVFTYFQYIEYSDAGFTIADSVYGSAFFASTGLHGLLRVVPIKNKNKNKNIRYYSIKTFEINKDINGKKEKLNLDIKFLEWFSGFTLLSTKLIVWGSNLLSGIGGGRLTKLVSSMYKLTN
jgi:hypothetical protein